MSKRFNKIYLIEIRFNDNKFFELIVLELFIYCSLCLNWIFFSVFFVHKIQHYGIETQVCSINSVLVVIHHYHYKMIHLMLFKSTSTRDLYLIRNSCVFNSLFPSQEDWVFFLKFVINTVCPFCMTLFYSFKTFLFSMHKAFFEKVSILIPHLLKMFTLSEFKSFQWNIK